MAVGIEFAVWPPRHNERAGGLIGAGRMRRADWLERLLAVGIRAVLEAIIYKRSVILCTNVHEWSILLPIIVWKDSHVNAHGVFGRESNANEPMHVSSEECFYTTAHALTCTSIIAFK